MSLEKDERIVSEVKRLTALFGKMEKNMLKTVSSLIQNAAFMTVTLEDLQEDINRDGPISRYQNGENQWGTKKSPEIEIYNAMIKNFLSTIKQLTELLPPDGEKEAKADPLLAFMKKK